MSLAIAKLYQKTKKKRRTFNLRSAQNILPAREGVTGLSRINKSKVLNRKSETLKINFRLRHLQVIKRCSQLDKLWNLITMPKRSHNSLSIYNNHKLRSLCNTNILKLRWNSNICILKLSWNNNIWKLKIWINVLQMSALLKC